MLHITPLLGAVALFLSPIVVAQNTSIPIVVPDDAKPLPQNLLGFSIEQDRWSDWAGTNARNQFTHDALVNYARLTGKPPHIRVGANSEDHTIWSPTVTVSSCAPASSISAFTSRCSSNSAVLHKPTQQFVLLLHLQIRFMLLTSTSADSDRERRFSATQYYHAVSRGHSNCSRRRILYPITVSAYRCASDF